MKKTRTRRHAKNPVLRRAKKPAPRRFAIGDPDFPPISVIIPVRNERRTIGKVLRQVKRIHPRVETIVVANGCTDGSDVIAAKHGAVVISSPEALGHDVGRSVGARAARGDILLFIDGDFVIPAESLARFARAVAGGTDVALNRYSGPVHVRNVHRVVLAKHVMNDLLFRSDLGGCSMTTVPHAISRKALQEIGTEQLAVPPKAQAIAMVKGLRILPVHAVNVGSINRRRKGRRKADPLGELIVGDHLEALAWFIQNTNMRGHHTDLARLREKVR